MKNDTVELKSQEFHGISRILSVLKSIDYCIGFVVFDERLKVSK